MKGMKKEWMGVLGVLAGALALAAGSSAGAAAQDRSDLGAMAAAARQSADAPALGLAVVRPGRPPQVAVDGVRCVGEDGAVRAADTWHWGSISKSMTATLVARLVERGVIDWDETVGDHLGELVPEMQEAYRTATFRHLLSHRAGLAPNIPVPRFAEFGQRPQDSIADRLRWVRIALTQSPVGPKEETYEYSNNGYVVAGAMLEAATGVPWEELMRREVFSPLGLSGAGFGAPRASRQDEEPCGHRPEGDVDRPVAIDSDNPAALGPAGRVHMPLADMARYLAAHASRRPDFLSPASYELLHSQPFGGIYALGWVVTGPRGRWHNGSNNEWYAEVAFNIDGDAAAAVVVNDGDIASVQPAVRELLGRLMKMSRSSSSSDLEQAGTGTAQRRRGSEP